VTEKIIEIRFGSEPSGFMSITVRGRAYKHRKDSWDGNWLLVDVRVQLPKFTAQVAGSVRAEELLRLSRELREFYESVSDTVVFVTHGGWLEFQIGSGRAGRVILSGRLADETENHSYLRFRLEADELALAGQMRTLHQAIEAYPVIGIT
jgi:hypothetical protein